MLRFKQENDANFLSPEKIILAVALGIGPREAEVKQGYLLGSIAVMRGW